MAIRLEPITRLGRDRYSLMGLVRSFFEGILKGYDPSKTYNLGDLLFIYDEPNDLFKFYIGRRNGITGPFDINDWTHLQDRTVADLIIGLYRNNQNQQSGNGHMNALDFLEQFFETAEDENKAKEIFEHITEGSTKPTEHATLMNIFQMFEGTADAAKEVLKNNVAEYEQSQLGDMYGELCANPSEALTAYMREPSTETGVMISF